MKSRVFVAVMAVALAAAAPAIAGLQGKPQIAGDPVVGSQLRAVVQWTGDSISYSWERCPSGEDNVLRCVPIPGATGDSYVAATEDVGSSIVVAVTVIDGLDRDYERSNPTAEVRPAPQRSPTPSPAPSPSPSPSPPVRTSVTTTAPEIAPTPTVRYLLPFPVVRIKGQLSDGGAIVSMLLVTAPRKAKVRVVCAGASCPVERLAQGPGRVRAFERFLAAGTRIVIRVRRPELVGKYVRITIREGKRPARRDACVLPGSARAAPCPEP
jgi:hypothetical protein